MKKILGWMFVITALFTFNAAFAEESLEKEAQNQEFKEENLVEEDHVVVATDLLKEITEDRGGDE